eukprot:TRINITY_DN4266_c2_g1_i1.p1 TRINITY_DN4266_c2_g1~~TRINITY_DN4266_c2_g1_i1.p1  ORF type:complete len:258 (+),score=16.06 TRINITY_DN4266_c2_g1_i1:103-876(+)
MRQKMQVPRWSNGSDNSDRRLPIRVPRLDLEGLSRSSVSSSETCGQWSRTQGSDYEKDFSLPMLAELLATTSEFNRRRGVHEKEDQRSVFECISVPPITIWTFIKNLHAFGGDWVVTTILIDRICKEGAIPLTPWNVHRVVLVCYAASTDRELSKSLCTAGGVTQGDMEEMHSVLTNLLSGNLSVTHSHIKNVQQNFARHIPQHERLYANWGALLSTPLLSRSSPTHSTESRVSMKQKLLDARMLAAEFYENAQCAV